MANVYCPRDHTTKLMSECLTCEHVRTEEDVSSIWCRYNIGRRKENSGKIQELIYLLQRKEESMARAYTMGRTKLGDKLMWEVEDIKKEIKKLKGENNNGN